MEEDEHSVYYRTHHSLHFFFIFLLHSPIVPLPCFLLEGCSKRFCWRTCPRKLWRTIKHQSAHVVCFYKFLTKTYVIRRSTHFLFPWHTDGSTMHVIRLPIKRYTLINQTAQRIRGPCCQKDKPVDKLCTWEYTQSTVLRSFVACDIETRSE